MKGRHLVLPAVLGLMAVLFLSGDREVTRGHPDGSSGTVDRLQRIYEGLSEDERVFFHTLVRRAWSIDFEDVKAWKQAFETLWDDVAYIDILLTILPADPLYDDDVYDRERAKRCQERIAACSLDDVARWEAEQPYGYRTRLDAALCLAIAESGRVEETKGNR